MLTMIFGILMFLIFFRLVRVAVKLSWGITKVVLGIIFAPVILILFAVFGFMTIAFIGLVIWGLFGFFNRV